MANPLWHALTRFESGKLAPALAFRNALGIVLPLAIGAGVNELPSAAVATTGALCAGFSDGDDPYPLRARRMLAASAAVGLAVALGPVLAGSHVGSALLVSAWAFAVGLLIALGQAPADIGTVSLVCLIVFSAQPHTPSQAALSGALAAAGGLLQTLLSLAFWPLRRHRLERRALSLLYRELAALATTPVLATEPPPASAEITAAHTALSGLTRDHSLNSERLRSLMNQAERIRLSLLTLSRLRVRVARELPGDPVAGLLPVALSQAAELLRAVASLLLDPLPDHPPRPPGLDSLQSLSDTLRAHGSPTTGDAHLQLEALLGQLRAATELAFTTTPPGDTAFRQRESAHPRRMRVESAIATLRANLDLRSAAFRHALRLAVAIAIATVLGRLLGVDRPFWLPMTVAIVLKPDFTTTFSRGLLRVVGTFAGLFFATLLFRRFRPDASWELALLALSAFLMRWVGPAHYGVFAVAVTFLVVLLLALTGVPPEDVVAARALNTTAGGAIALLAYRLWPTWERAQVGESLAQLLDAYRDYFRAVRDAHSLQGAPNATLLDRTRLAARLARSNLEASMDRLATEPGTPQETASRWASILASSHRFIHAVMSLESALSRGPAPLARGAFETYCNRVEFTLFYLSATLRGSALAHADMPDLRESYRELSRADPPPPTLVSVEADRITNSLNTLSIQVLELDG